MQDCRTADARTGKNGRHAFKTLLDFFDPRTPDGSAHELAGAGLFHKT